MIDKGPCVTKLEAELGSTQPPHTPDLAAASYLRNVIHNSFMARVTRMLCNVTVTVGRP